MSTKKQAVSRGGDQPDFGCFYTAFWFLLLHWEDGKWGNARYPPDDFPAGFLSDEWNGWLLLLINICVARLSLSS